MNNKEKPKLKLSKRTIANLNNMEMRYVLGGDGDDDDVSRKACEKDPDEDLLSRLKDMTAKHAISLLIPCKKG